MPALNFQKRFADLVIKGKKRQSIRPYRKDNRNPIKGQTLFLYKGMRTKHCKKLKEVICKNVEVIIIKELDIVVGVKRLSWNEADSLAIKEGFLNQDLMIEFFSKLYGLPFHGLLIKW